MRGVYLTASLLGIYLLLVGINAYQLTGPHHHTLYIIGICLWSLCSVVSVFNLKCAWEFRR